MTLARLAKSRGNRGELIAESFVNDLADAIGGKEVQVFRASGEQVGHFSVDELWEHKGRPVIKLAGVDSISAAEQLEGCEIRIPREMRPPAPEGEFYHDDLVGCVVIDTATGSELGRVNAWREFGGPGLLELENGIMIPFARSICVEIDVAAKRIRVDLPEGLKDLT